MDLLVAAITWRMSVTYLPHADSSHEELCPVFEQLHCVLADSQQLGQATVLGGDFNTQLKAGKRVQMLRSHIANDTTHHDSWTFCSRWA